MLFYCFEVLYSCLAFVADKTSSRKQVLQLLNTTANLMTLEYLAVHHRRGEETKKNNQAVIKMMFLDIFLIVFNFIVLEIGIDVNFIHKNVIFMVAKLLFFLRHL